MGYKIKVEGYSSLYRDSNSNAIINSSKSEYETYMARTRARQSQADEIKSACREINSLKNELHEIKQLLKKIGTN